MKASNLIAGAIHAASGRFSYYWDFAEWLQQHYENIPYDLDMVWYRLNQDIIHMKRHRERVDPHSALDYLIASDLERACDKWAQLPTEEQFADRIQKACDQSIEILSKLGFEIPKPEVIVVEQLPEPYHKMDWVALVTDEVDWERYSIKPGIYLLESELSPYYTELTLAHELVHIAISKASCQLHGRGLEEGIAEIIGTLYIGKKLYSPDIARNVFIHSRFGNRLSQANTLYLDYTRLAFLFYRRFGLRGMIQLMHEGRERIKEVEADCIANGVDKLRFRFKKGKWDKELLNLGDSLLLGWIPNLVVGPLAAYVSRFVRSGDTIEEVAKNANVDVAAAREALEEIQERTFMILLDKNRIDFSDLRFFGKDGVFRYEAAQDKQLAWPNEAVQDEQPVWPNIYDVSTWVDTAQYTNR